MDDYNIIYPIFLFTKIIWIEFYSLLEMIHCWGIMFEIKNLILDYDSSLCLLYNLNIKICTIVHVYQERVDDEREINANTQYRRAVNDNASSGDRCRHAWCDMGGAGGQILSVCVIQTHTEKIVWVCVSVCLLWWKYLYVYDMWENEI